MSTGALSTGARWGGSALAVLALHAGVAALLLRSMPPFQALPGASAAVLLDLTPAPAPAPPTQPPAPEPAPKPAPELSQQPALAPALAPPVVAPAEAILPPPRAKPKPPAQRAPTIRPAPHPATVPPAPARPTAPAADAAAAPASLPANPDAVPTWRGELVARLQQAKRYPASARSRGDQGVAVVTFTLDRAGRVLATALVRTSGIPALDDEALALLRRAEPLPAMPAEMAGPSVTLTLPVRFALR